LGVDGTGVTIGGTTIGDTGCGRIIDITIDEAVDFASKEILGKDTPTVNPDNYVTIPKIWTIVMRVPLTKRNTLRADKNNHVTIMVNLNEGEVDYVKLEEFNYRWAGNECYDCPWLVTITLVSILY